MNKTTRNILIIVAVVLLVFGIAVAIYNIFKTEPIDANVENNNILDNANNGLENVINDILEENEVNEENIKNEENTEENNTTENTQASSSQGQESSSDEGNDNTSENQSTPGEQKAIELVKAEWKKEWGNLDDVSFNNVMIQGDGKYVVSVNDSKTTKVIHRYVVDTDTGLVEQKD